jgi:hypothetical protein
LREGGKCVPASLTRGAKLPGKICRARQFLPGQGGNSFHFVLNAREGNPAFPRKILVHAGTGNGKQE